jgi:hypothetical protein
LVAHVHSSCRDRSIVWLGLDLMAFGMMPWGFTVLVPSVDTRWSSVLLLGELQRWDLGARDGSGAASTNKHGSVLDRVEGGATILPPG